MKSITTEELVFCARRARYTMMSPICLPWQTHRAPHRIKKRRFQDNATFRLSVPTVRPIMVASEHNNKDFQLRLFNFQRLRVVLETIISWQDIRRRIRVKSRTLATALLLSATTHGKDTVLRNAWESFYGQIWLGRT